MSADMRGGFQMEQCPHSSDGSEIFTNDQQGSGALFTKLLKLKFCLN